MNVGWTIQLMNFGTITGTVDLTCASSSETITASLDCFCRKGWGFYAGWTGYNINMSGFFDLTQGKWQTNDHDFVLGGKCRSDLEKQTVKFDLNAFPLGTNIHSGGDGSNLQYGLSMGGIIGAKCECELEF